MSAATDVIDADGHVEECPETFADAYLEQPWRARRPQVVGTESGRPYWVIEDQLLPRFAGRGCFILGTPTAFGAQRMEGSNQKTETYASMEMRDVAQRFADIKKEGLDLQVIYPTLFLAGRLTADPVYGQALCRAYNNWISEACAKRPDTFKWVAVVTLDDVPGAVAELGRAQGMGAVGVMILGTYGERMLGEPEFVPFFAEAAKRDMGVGIHVGWSCAGVNNLVNDLFNSVVTPFAFPVLASFVSLIGAGTFDRFPNLRIAFLEAGCEWIPYLNTRMNHFYDFAKERMPRALPAAKRRPEDYLRGGNIYISGEVEDALLPYVVDLMGEDHILYASDIPHSDRMFDSVAYLKGRNDLKEGAVKKILNENPRRFYAM